MLAEILHALFKAGLPVALASYALVWWALRHGYLGPVSSLKELEKGFSRLSREKKAARRRQKKSARSSAVTLMQSGEKPPAKDRLNPVHNKWLAFGGGFYGVVGLLTYGVVELGELRDFFLAFGDLPAFFAQLGFGTLVSIFIGAARNFVVAIAWPAFWLSDIHSDYIWVWFVVAYAGYWAGARLAMRRFTAAHTGEREG